MEPVEINAGAWYLRSLRADDRITDAPALSDLGVADPQRYVADADAAWADETGFVWAVCIPTTGELVALIGVNADNGGTEDTADSGILWGRARSGHDDALEAAVGPVRRFAGQALGLDVGEDMRTGLD